MVDFQHFGASVSPTFSAQNAITFMPPKKIREKNYCHLHGIFLFFAANALFWCVGKPDLSTIRNKQQDRRRNK
jgi:hypothetical protein